MVFLGYYWDISAIVSRKFLSELRIYGPFSGLFYWSSLNQALNQIREGWGSFARPRPPPADPRPTPARPPPDPARPLPTPADPRLTPAEPRRPDHWNIVEFGFHLLWIPMIWSRSGDFTEGEIQIPRYCNGRAEYKNLEKNSLILAPVKVD